MLYTVIIAPKAKKQIDKLPAKIKEKIRNAIAELLINPYLGKALKAQLSGLYSYRIANYRIIYDIVRHRLLMLRIDRNLLFTTRERLRQFRLFWYCF